MKRKLNRRFFLVIVLAVCMTQAAKSSITCVRNIS